MKLKSNRCVNSKWTARFLSKDNHEYCQCPGCKVTVECEDGYRLILNEEEIKEMLYIEFKRGVGISNDMK